MGKEWMQRQIRRKRIRIIWTIVGIVWIMAWFTLCLGDYGILTKDLNAEKTSISQKTETYHTSSLTQSIRSQPESRLESRKEEISSGDDLKKNLDSMRAIQEEEKKLKEKQFIESIMKIDRRKNP